MVHKWPDAGPTKPCQEDRRAIDGFGTGIRAFPRGEARAAGFQYLTRQVMPRAMPHLEPRWFYRHWRRARPLSVCPAVYAVVVLSLSSACGASVPPCHCTCPVGVLPAHASAATNASAAVGNEQSPQVTKETYALSAAESTPVASAERKEPLSEQELLKRYEGK